MGHGGNKTQRIDITDSYDPRIVGRAAQKGTLFRFIPASGDPELLIKKDDGFSTEWESVGGANSLPVTVARVRDANANVDISSAPADIDGVTLDVDDIVLLTNQAAPEENGVYTFNGAGIALTRSTGWSASVDFVPGRQVYVDQGNTNAEQLWANANYVPNLETDPVTFINVSASAGMATDFSNAQPAANSIDMQNNEINNVGGPTLNGDAANKVYVDNLVGAKMNQDFSDAQPAANAIDLNNNLINNVLDPVSDQDAATKKYVDDNAGGAPTGTPGYIAFYDGAGNLSPGDIGWEFVLGVPGGVIFGARTGVALLQVGNSGSLIVGVVANRASIVTSAEGTFAGGYATAPSFGVDPFGAIRASARGAMAFGYTTNEGSQVGATALGSTAHGYADGFGQVIAAGIGSLVAASVNGGSVYTSGDGAFANGRAAGNGQVIASGAGSQAQGFTFTNSNIEASGAGAHASGYAFGDGAAPDTTTFITASGDGSSATGQVTGGYASTISATGGGAFATGRIDSSIAGLIGLITAGGPGSFAQGYSEGGSIVAPGDGAFASGVVKAGGSISANGGGAHAFGAALNAGSSVTASGNCAFAIGLVNTDTLEINASGDGAYAGGNANSGSVTSSGRAAFSHGDFLINVATLGVNFGLGNVNTSYGCLIIGRFNFDDGWNGNAWVATNPAFLIGNGTDDLTRSNAFRVDKDGAIHETGSMRVPVRVVLAADVVVSARTDRSIIVNDPAAGAWNIQLPPGEEGLIFNFTAMAANTGVYTILPDGADTINDTSTLGSGPQVLGLIFSGGVWYNI